MMKQRTSQQKAVNMLCSYCDSLIFLCRRIFCGSNLWRTCVSYTVLSLVSLLGGCVFPDVENPRPSTSQAIESSPSTTSQDIVSAQENAFDVVDCLLPGQVRRLGAQMIYMTPRRPVRSTVEDCIIRGGEYTSYDRADYKTSLGIWKKAADTGNVEAQYYVGSLYEQGATGAPNYATAAEWYEKSAEQGHRQAAMNLGRLYDQGLGVPKDPQLAFTWMTKASGLEQPSLTNLLNRSVVKQLQSLKKTVQVREKEIDVLKDSLTQTQEEKTQLQQLLVKEQSEAQSERDRMVLLEKQSRQLKNDLQKASNQIPKRERQIQQFQQQLQTLEAELVQKRQEGEQAKAAGEYIVRLEQQYQQLEAELQTARQPNPEQERQIQQYQGQLQVLETELAQKRQEGEQAKADRAYIVRLEQQYQQLEANLQTAQQPNPEQEAEIQQYQRQLQSLETELGQKRQEGEKSKALEANYRVLQGQLALLTKEKERELSVKQQREEEFKLVKRQLDSSREQLSKQEMDMAELTKKIEALESSASLNANLPPGEDLGLDGPSIQIIDPPMISTRGVKVAAGRREVYLSPDSSRSLTGRVLAPAGLWELRVNGLVTSLDKEGIFTYELPTLRTKERSIPVDIVAVDIQNKRTISSLKLLSDKSLMTSQSSLSSATEKPFGQYYALVIGNNDYQQWDPLQNAIADAEAVGQLLGNQYGFKVKFLKNASRTDILKSLNEYRKLLTARDNLLIYYAGHGFWEKNINRGYWIPVEADLEDNSNWILLPTVTDLLQLMSAKHILVVADSCFAGKLTRSGLAQLRPGLTGEARMDLLKTLADKRVRTAMTSGGLSPVLDSGGGGHSIFTKAFLNVLDENTEILETERIFLAIKNRVMRSAQRLNTEQIPTYAPVYMAGHESLGDFIFVPNTSDLQLLSKNLTFQYPSEP